MEILFLQNKSQFPLTGNVKIYPSFGRAGLQAYKITRIKFARKWFPKLCNLSQLESIATNRISKLEFSPVKKLFEKEHGS